jgi:hypothetical protein
MRASTLATMLVLTDALLAPRVTRAQGVVVDQGRFDVSIDGRSAGTEEFTIRRAGIGREDAIFANAVVQLTRGGRQQAIRPLLRAVPPEGVATAYQVEVTGVDSMTLRLSRVGSRYVAVIQSARGEEQREFPADPETRILEQDVAHLYYFLRDTRAGATTPVIEPRTRSRLTLETGPATDEDLRVGQSLVPARRVDFKSGDDVRTVWYDRLGRVLRVSIPSRGYLAQRTDLLR